MSTKPLNDPTNQSDAEASFWAKAEMEAENKKIETPRTAKEPLDCRICHTAMSTDEGCEPTDICHHCAQDRVIQLECELQAKEQELTETRKEMISIIQKGVQESADRASNMLSLNQQLAAVTAEREELKKQLADAQAKAKRYQRDWKKGAKMWVDSQLAAQSEQLRRMREALVELKRNVTDVILPNAKNLTLDLGQVALWDSCCGMVDRALADAPAPAQQQRETTDTEESL